jgi:hypothetical protein
MTWRHVLIAAAVVAVCVPFAALGAGWLIRMDRRTSFASWPWLVALAGAVAVAVGITWAVSVVVS